MAATTKLLTTKLYIPRIRPSYVARPRLLARLDQGMEGKLTLISAVPGSGKTTVVSEWHAAHAPGRFPLAWVSLDESDNDTTRFWSYIAKAIETLSAGISDDVLALLNSYSSPPIEEVLITLINAIDSTLQHEFALVLDDYHYIETESIHASLTFLLEHLPQNMHLILITRIDPPLPLARFRAHNQLMEIRTVDLRFTYEETITYFQQSMKLNLSSKEVAQLVERTEGWIAGLQLAALSLQKEEKADFLHSFNGNHRYILEYLAQEVLDQQPAHIQRFLQQTAILRRLSGELCNAIIGRTDSQEILQWLEKANLFLTSLDQEQRWYRYHSLFRDFLLRVLSKTVSEADIRALHLRASAWYEQHHLMHEAVHHMLASENFERAADLIERVAREEWMRGEALTLRCWLQELPDSLLHSRLQLKLFYIWSLIAANQVEEAQHYLKEVMSTLQESQPLAGKNHPDRAVMKAEAIILQATLARFMNDVPRTIELSQQALQYLPEDDLILNSINALNLGHAYRLRGDVGLASETFKRSITLARAVGNTYTVLLALNNMIQLQIEQGALHSAATYCEESLQFAAQHNSQQLPILSDTYTKKGELFYQWNQLDEARLNGEYGINLGQSKGNTRFLLQGYMAQARLLHAQGEHERAHEILTKAAQVANEHHSSVLIQHIVALQARLWLLQGQLSRAFSWLERCKQNVEDVPNYVYEFEYLTLAHLLIAQGRAKEVVGLLERLRQAARRSQRMGTVIEVCLLQALANYALGQKIEAFTALERALSLAEPEGYIRLFLDEGTVVAQLLTEFIEWKENTPGKDSREETTYAHTLIACFARIPSDVRGTSSQKRINRTRPDGQLPLVEPLGEREKEVLQYLAAGLSNQAIADEMVVAVSTVKSHLKSIYSKLNVESRTRAVARARELHLL
jgi:LuxR family maltose regulon positive regulatory protein